MSRIGNVLGAAVVPLTLLFFSGCSSKAAMPAYQPTAADGEPTKVTPPGLPPGTRMPIEKENVQKLGFEHSHLTPDPVTGRLPTEESEAEISKGSLR